MKKLLLAVLLLISAMAGAQSYRNDTATYGIYENRIKVKNALALPKKWLQLNTTDTSAQIFITPNGAPYAYTGGNSGQYLPFVMNGQADTFYLGATFDTTTRVLSLQRQSGGFTNVSIPRGGSVTGISSLTSSRSGNIVTLTGDNGSTVQYSVRDADSSTVSNDYIQNQNSTSQVANYKINGVGTAQSFTSVQGVGAKTFTFQNTSEIERWTFLPINSETGIGDIGYDLALGSYTSAGVFKQFVVIYSRETASATFADSVIGNSFRVRGSTSAAFLKGDGSLDNNSYATVAQLALKLNISDTAAMLSNRLKISDTATMLAPFVQYSDTAAMLSNRLKISDTATMLAPFVQYSDTAAMLSNRLKISDTATMLAPFVQYSDTANIVSGYTRLSRFSDSLTAIRGRINGDGILSTAGQPNVTSVGILTSLTVSGLILSTKASEVMRFTGTAPYETWALGSSKFGFIGQANQVVTTGTTSEFGMASTSKLKFGTGASQTLAFTLNDDQTALFASTATGLRFISNNGSDNGIDGFQSGGLSVLANLYRSEGKIQASSATIDATATLWNDDSNGSTVTYTLPSTSSLTGGRFMFIKTGTGTLTLSAYAANKIVKKDGSTTSSISLTSADGLNQYYFDGNIWYQLN